MTQLKKGLLVALIQILLVCSLGAKLLYDRATRPRIWVEGVSYDPSLPIRGRYLALQAKVETDISTGDAAASKDFYTGYQPARLEVRNGKLFAAKDDRSPDYISIWKVRGQVVTAVSEPSLFFIPDTANDPTRLKPGEHIWFEATIPKKGPPRPIRLAISKADGTFTPLNLK